MPLDTAYKSHHEEVHLVHRIGWLRAAVLGANDGIVSTASLLFGMASAAAEPSLITLTGVAGVVAGASSMAAGEYVSVSSQADLERADLEDERRALAEHPEEELQELASNYEARGLTPALAREVAEQLTAHDGLSAHAREELGFHLQNRAAPIRAALASAASFLAGGLIPLGVVVLVPPTNLQLLLAIATLASLSALGWISARLGGAPPVRAVARILGWGCGALALTGFAGNLVGGA